MGAAGGGLIALGSFVALETVKGFEFASMRKMVKLISASHNRDYTNKSIVKLVKKYNRKFPQDGLGAKDLVDRIINLDETAQLCDGTVRGNTNPRKLKHKLAKRKHLIQFIHVN